MRVGWQVEKFALSVLDEFPDFVVVVDGEVIHNDDLTRFERRGKCVLDVLKKGGAGDATLVHHASVGVHTLCGYGGNQADFTFAPLRSAVRYSPAPDNPSVKPSQPEPAAGLVYKHQAARCELEYLLEPLAPRLLVTLLSV